MSCASGRWTPCQKPISSPLGKRPQGHIRKPPLGAGSWELENPALRALRDKIRTGRRILKDVYGSPLYGIKTGLNAAFVIDTATKDRL